MNNEYASWKLNEIAKRIKEGHYNNAIFLGENEAIACEIGASAIQKLDDEYIRAKLYKNSLYGKMVQPLTDAEEKFVRKVFKHENDNHAKNCTITITQATGKHTSINKYKFDDYRIATAICNILDNVRYTEGHYTTQDNTSLYEYADTDSTKENTENATNI